MIKKSSILLFLLLSLICSGCFSITEPDLEEGFDKNIGASLVLNPLDITVVKDKTFKIKIYLAGVENILGLYSQLKFDPSFLVYQRSEITANDESGLSFGNTSPVLITEINDSKDTLSVNMGFPGGAGEGITGTGDVYEVIFKALKQGDTNISILSGARLTDNDLEEIEIKQLKGTTVHIE